MEPDVREAMVSQLAEEVQELVGDLDQAEAEVQALMRRLGGQVLQRVIDRQDGRQDGESLRCSCGGRLRLEGYRTKQVLTRLGAVQVRRAYYRCRDCGQGQHPYDRASGLGAGQLSNRLASAVSVAAVQVGFAEAARMVEQLLGVRVDDNTIQRTAERAGQEAIRRQQEAVAAFQQTRAFPEPQEHPLRLYVSLDGTTAPIREGWKEAKCAAIYWDDPIEGRQQRYVARFQTSEAFGWSMWLEACRCGLRQAAERVVLGDGAEWLWNLVAIYMPGATQILDWYHAKEHLWACARELYGEGSPQADAWVERMATVLWDQGGAALLKRLRRSAGGRADPAAGLASLIGYVEGQVQRMDYPAYRQRGLDVGSGPVESTCKRLVGGRLKQGGMRWSMPGADAILALRTVWCNRDWSAFWQSKPLADSAQRRPAA